ncbi:MAG: response regulator transcription factor [Acidimicrobiales bacterium]
MSAPAGPVRVGLVDDQPLMRVAFRTILESFGLCIVGEAADGEEAVRLAVEHRPDVVLMDVRMAGRDGVWATAEIGRRCPGVRVLILTTFDDDEVLHGAARRCRRVPAQERHARTGARCGPAPGGGRRRARPGGHRPGARPLPPGLPRPRRRPPPSRWR